MHMIFFKKPNPPCIKTKCLKYPVCKNKQILACNTLAKYYENLAHDYTGDEAWLHIKKYLPTMQGIRLDDGNPLPPFTRKFR